MTWPCWTTCCASPPCPPSPAKPATAGVAAAVAVAVSLPAGPSTASYQHPDAQALIRPEAATASLADARVASAWTDHAEGGFAVLLLQRDRRAAKVVLAVLPARGVCLTCRTVIRSARLSGPNGVSQKVAAKPIRRIAGSPPCAVRASHAPGEDSTLARRCRNGYTARSGTTAAPTPGGCPCHGVACRCVQPSTRVNR